MMKKIFRYALIACAVWLFASLLYGLYIYKEVLAFRAPAYSKQITVYDWSKKEFTFWVGPKNPRYVTWNAISSYVKWAVILSEDGKFYQHSGIDYEAMKNAMKRNLEVGKYVRGGSTITQQLAKNLFLTREKTLIRKFKELIIAFIIEYGLTKTRILELYLNLVELGPSVYGVSQGSSFYFGKSPAALNPLEAALLASLLPGPRVYNPYRNLDRVEKNAKRVLERMKQAGVIGADEYERYKASDLTIGLGKKIEVREHQLDREMFGNHSAVTFRKMSSRQ